MWIVLFFTFVIVSLCVLEIQGKIRESKEESLEFLVVKHLKTDFERKKTTESEYWLEEEEGSLG